MFIFFIILTFLPIVVALVFLCSARWERRPNTSLSGKIWPVIAVAGLLVNPFSQAFLLEGMDNLRGRSMANQAHAEGIIGMKEYQVQELMGEPSRVWQYNATLTWEYKQIPGYWFGSYFQVFFSGGVVYGVEANDD